MDIKDLFALESSNPINENPNKGCCSECDWRGLLSECETELEQETWELPPYEIYLCPRCNNELDDYFYEEEGD